MNAAVETVRALPPEDQEAVLVLLLKELIRIYGGNGLIPFSVEGEQLGYFVPPKAADFLAEQDVPKLSPEREAELRDRAARKHTAIPVQQMIAELKAMEGELQTLSR